MCANTTMNRFVEECSTHTAAGEAACVNDPNCKWHQNSADELNTDGSINTSPSGTEGLFAHDRIAKFFDHRDDCDRHVITIVTLHEGACDDTKSGGAKTCNTVAPSATCTINGASYTDSPECTKIACAAADKTKCALEIFRWKGQEVHDQTHTGESIFAKGNNEQKFPEWEAGSYAVQYETIDASGLKATGCRDIQNVDHTHPIIQILGSDQMTLEATHQGNYIDDGATCSDQVDGVISQNVEVSGDVVNLSKVGTYTITYNCKDSANNAAPAAQRTVVVAQTSCPKCTVHGPEDKDIIHEASFPYSDAGASCSDVIDGDVSTLCFTAAYRVGVTADGVVSYGGVTATGEKQDQWAGGADRTGKGYCDEMEGETDANCVGKTLAQCTSETTCKWNQYSPCGTSAAGSGNLINDNADSGSTHAGAQIGTYYITYRAKNTVGLYNDGENCRGGAQEYVRKVTVKDTLRPVITLKYDSSSDGSGSETVAQGTFSAIGDTTTEDLSQTDTLSDKLYPSVKDAVYESQNTFDDTWTGKG